MDEAGTSLHGTDGITAYPHDRALEYAFLKIDPFEGVGADDMGAETGAQLVSGPWSDDGCGGTWGSIRAVRRAVFLEFTDFLGHFADRFVAVVGFFGHRFQADLFQT